MLKRIREMLKCQKGFTLVEMMVVLAIIGILAALAVPRFTNATQQAQATKIAADLRTIDSAVAMYIAVNGTTTPPALTNASPTATTAASSNLVPTYLQAVPLPPAGTYSLNATTFAAEWTGTKSGAVARTSGTPVATIQGDL